MYLYCDRQLAIVEVIELFQIPVLGVISTRSEAQENACQDNEIWLWRGRNIAFF